jgi:hypothetical protein
MSKVFVLGRVRTFQAKHIKLLEQLVERNEHHGHPIDIKPFVGGARVLVTRSPFPEHPPGIPSFAEELLCCAADDQSIVMEQVWMDDRETVGNGPWKWFARITIVGRNKDSGQLEISEAVMEFNPQFTWENHIQTEMERLNLHIDPMILGCMPLMTLVDRHIYRSWFEFMAITRI